MKIKAMNSSAGMINWVCCIRFILGIWYHWDNWYQVKSITGKNQRLVVSSSTFIYWIKVSLLLGGYKKQAGPSKLICSWENMCFFKLLYMLYLKETAWHFGFVNTDIHLPWKLDVECIQFESKNLQLQICSSCICMAAILDLHTG